MIGNSIFDVRPKVYVTDHSLSQEASQILAKGFDAQMVPPVTLLDGLAIGYGILRGVGNIIHQAEEANRPYLYCDHSFFSQTRSQVQKGLWNGYFRLIKNGRYTHDVDNVPSDRWDALSIPLKPWRTNGSKVVVAPMSKFVAFHEYGKMDAANLWLQQIMTVLTEVTDRPIEIKPKDSEKPLKYALEDAWCLVTHDSMAAVEAAILGIPVFTSKNNAAAPVAEMDLERIEAPHTPDREEWLRKLAYQQFTVEEIKNGTAREILYGE